MILHNKQSLPLSDRGAFLCVASASETHFGLIAPLGYNTSAIFSMQRGEGMHTVSIFKKGKNQSIRIA